MTKPRRNAYLALLYNALVWGSAFAIIKPIFDLITPLQYLFFRYLIAGIIALPIFLSAYLKHHFKISYLIKVTLLEIAGLALPILILYEGLNQTSALEASLIGVTGPIFIILGGITFLNERETKREWQGLSLALLGSLMIVFEPLWNGHGFVGSSLTGNILILIYYVLYTAYALFAKNYYKTKPPLSLVSLSYLFVALIYGLILGFQHALPSFELLTDYSLLLPILYMAIPGGIIANIFYLYSASRIEVSEANLFNYLHAVVAIPASYFLLGEVISPTSVLAILIIALGVYRAETRSSH